MIKNEIIDIISNVLNLNKKIKEYDNKKPLNINNIKIQYEFLNNISKLHYYYYNKYKNKIKEIDIKKTNNIINAQKMMIF